MGGTWVPPTLSMMPILESLFGNWGTVVVLGFVLAALLAAFAWLETDRFIRPG